jgi:hypothetical protein
VKQIIQCGLKMKLANFEQRLHSAFPRIGIGGAVDLQSLAVNVKSIRNPNVKLGEFNPAFETSRESFNYASPQDWLGSHYHEADANRQYDEKQKEQSANPAPSP